MRVLHAIPTLDAGSGGPSQAIQGLVSAQVRAGLEVSVLSGWEDVAPVAAAEALQRAGAEVRMVGPLRGLTKFAPELPNLMHEMVSRADVVHLHGVWESVQHIGADTARRMRRPYLFRPCGMLDPWSLAQGKWKKKLYLALRLRGDLNRAAALHATSDSEAAGFAALSLRQPTLVVPNGLDWTEFAELEKMGPFSTKHPQLRGRRYVLFLGRMHPKKGLELLMEAFAKGAPPDVLLTIAGDGDPEYNAALRMRAEKLGIAERVVYTGFLSGRERIAAMRDAEIFALPSSQENFGIAVAESLASGTPVLLSQEVAIAADAASAGVGLALPRNADAFAKALREQLASSWKNTVREQAICFARERYDWSVIAQVWRKNYEGILAG